MFMIGMKRLQPPQVSQTEHPDTNERDGTASSATRSSSRRHILRKTTNDGSGDRRRRITVVAPIGGGRRSKNQKSREEEGAIITFIKRRFNANSDDMDENRTSHLEEELMKLRKTTKDTIEKSRKEMQRIRNERDRIRSENDHLVRRCRDLEQTVKDLRTGGSGNDVVDEGNGAGKDEKHRGTKQRTASFSATLLNNTMSLFSSTATLADKEVQRESYDTASTSSSSSSSTLPEEPSQVSSNVYSGAFPGDEDISQENHPQRHCFESDSNNCRNHDDTPKNKRRLEDLERTIERQTIVIDHLKRTHITQNGKIHSLHEIVESLQETIESFKLAIANLEDELNEKQMKHDRVSNAVKNETNCQIERLRHRIDDLERLLKEKEYRMEQLTNDYAEYKHRNNREMDTLRSNNKKQSVHIDILTRELEKIPMTTSSSGGRMGANLDPVKKLSELRMDTETDPIYYGQEEEKSAPAEHQSNFLPRASYSSQEPIFF